MNDFIKIDDTLRHKIIEKIKEHTYLDEIKIIFPNVHENRYNNTLTYDFMFNSYNSGSVEICNKTKKIVSLSIEYNPSELRG